MLAQYMRPTVEKAEEIQEEKVQLDDTMTEIKVFLPNGELVSLVTEKERTVGEVCELLREKHFPNGVQGEEAVDADVLAMNTAELREELLRLRALAAEQNA